MGVELAHASRCGICRCRLSILERLVGEVCRSCNERFPVIPWWERGLRRGDTSSAEGSSRAGHQAGGPAIPPRAFDESACAGGGGAATFSAGSGGAPALPVPGPAAPHAGATT